MTTWLIAHPGRTVGLHKVASIFGRAYGSAASFGNITSGFERTGNYPLNTHVSPDHLFLPSEVIQYGIEMEVGNGGRVEENEEPNGSASGLTKLFQNNFLPADQLQPNLEDVTGPSSSALDILNDISPLPKLESTGQTRNTKRKITGAQVLTGTPFMDEVKTQVQNKMETENRRSVRARKQVKHTIFQDDSDTEPVEDFI